MQSPSNSQKTAICHKTGPMLVMAGPGSGKTFVMIERILYLIHEIKVVPDQILVISFSKAAALQLQERFYKQNHCKKEAITFATFHAFFFQILKEAYHYTSKDIIQLKEKKEILLTILTDPRFLPSEEKEKLNTPEEMVEKVEEILNKISFYKNKGKKEMEEKESPQFISIYQEYNRMLRGSHKLDFDDMGLLCYQLLRKTPDLLERWQKKFSYIMIDEFQDINEIQFHLIYLLVKENCNLFVVGDDDQAIYSFRGASPKFMLEFEKFFPQTTKVLLETNFRCSDKIVEKSLKLIEVNKYRLKKEIRAFHRSEEEVKIKSFLNTYEQYEYITKRVGEIVKKGGSYREISCIFRTNRQMTALAEVLVRKRIPFSLKEKCNSIFQHFIGKDLLHYLKFFCEGKNRKDFLMIMNKPLRYFSRYACKKEIINWEDLLEYYKNKEYMMQAVFQLQKMEEWIKRLDLFGAVYYLRKAGGYEDYLKEYCKRQELNWEEVKEILDFIHNSFRGICSLKEWQEKVEDYENALEKSKEEKNGISLITMHACKGLEFDFVFLPDCNEGKIPHTKAVSEDQLEEERRMFYVAMTRAKQELEILYVENEKKPHLPKSRFLNVFGEERQSKKLF